MIPPSTQHSLRPFPRLRRATIGVLNAAKRKNMIHCLVEFDVTEARRQLRQLRKDQKDYISFTGYLIHCVAKSVESNKIMHAYRNRRNQLVLFDDVDVSTTIERKIEGNSEVVPRIIRNANRKSIGEISRELKKEKEENVKEAEVFRSMNLFLALPPFIRQMVFRTLDKAPKLMKKKAGTIMLTSINMVGTGAGWGIPIATHTLNVAIGSIVDRVVEKENKFETRQHLCITFSFDHDIIDGAPAARFIKNLKRKVEEGSIND